MLRIYERLLIGGLVLAALAVVPGEAEAQVGIKGGFLYSSLDFDDADDVVDSSNGWTAGLFFGTGGVVALQGEINVLQKGASDAGGDIKLYYVQFPVLLRVGGGSTVKVYGIGGPTFDVKVGESGDELAVVKDFEGIDIGLTAGVGFEVGHFLIEGRANWGLKNIAESVSAILEGDKLTSKSFAIQAGWRF
jgi:hypothetical protein